MKQETNIARLRVRIDSGQKREKSKFQNVIQDPSYTSEVKPQTDTVQTLQMNSQTNTSSGRQMFYQEICSLLTC